MNLSKAAAVSLLALVAAVVAADAQDAQALLPANNLFNAEEIRAGFNRLKVKPLDKAELQFEMLTPKDWESRPITVAPDQLAADYEEFVPLAEIAPPGLDNVVLQVRYIRPGASATLVQLIDAFAKATGFQVVTRRAGRYNKREVEDALLSVSHDLGTLYSRFTLSRHGDLVFLVAGSAPETEYGEYAKIFGLAAVSFTPTAASAPPQALKPATPAAGAAPGGAASAARDEAENIVFILDASGSMVGIVDNRMKMSIAKEVMIGLIRDLPEDVNVGLVAYGHRRTNDCTDIEELAPLGPPDMQEMERRITDLQCRGRTPIAGSIRKVAAGLKAANQQATIILVSDGEETCGGDPCGLVKAMKAAGIKFVMHVIGFDVDERVKAQLSCIAEAGGGKYYNAKNASDLRLATRVAAMPMPEKLAKPTGPGKVWIDPPAIFSPRSTVPVHFEASADFDQHAWIGIVPADIPHGNPGLNDQHDISYQYLLGRTNGTLELEAPALPGKYDARLHDTQLDGREVAFASLEVKTAQAELSLEKTEFGPGESITVQFKSPQALAKGAWAGIVPAGVPHGKESVNDDHEMAWAYVEGQQSGTVSLKAPSQKGKYDVRLNDTAGGSEIASVPFAVVEVQGGIRLETNEFFVGETMQVHFETAVVLDGSAWAGTVPSDVPHGKEDVNDQHEIDWAYIPQQTSGTLAIPAPRKPGKYDVRLNDASGGSEIAYASFTAKLAQARVWLDAAKVAQGSDVQVHYAVEGWVNNDAWIGLIPSSVPHGEESVNDAHQVAYRYLQGNREGAFTFKAPGQPGSYDFRLNDTNQDGSEIASVTFTVE